MKKIKEWWKNMSYRNKGIFMGVTFGLIKMPFFAVFGIHISESILKFFEFPDIYICKLFDISGTESCGFFALIYGFIYNPIFYGIIGGLLGYLIAKLRKK